MDSENVKYGMKEVEMNFDENVENATNDYVKNNGTINENEIYSSNEFSESNTDDMERKTQREIIKEKKDSIVERILYLMSRNGMSQKQFAEKIGESPSKLSHLIKGRNNPSLDIMLKISNAFPTIRLSWLLKGEGDMWSTGERMAESDDIEKGNGEDKNEMKIEKEKKEEEKNERKRTAIDTNSVKNGYFSQNLDVKEAKQTEVPLLSKENKVELSYWKDEKENGTGKELENTQSTIKKRKIEKVIVLYDDGSWEVR